MFDLISAAYDAVLRMCMPGLRLSTQPTVTIEPERTNPLRDNGSPDDVLTWMLTRTSHGASGSVPAILSHSRLTRRALLLAFPDEFISEDASVRYVISGAGLSHPDVLARGFVLFQIVVVDGRDGAYEVYSASVPADQPELARRRVAEISARLRRHVAAVPTDELGAEV